jgi:hypothetical protein
MPWEIDHALLIFDKLKQSSYLINTKDTLYLDSVLNLSSQIINWETSKISKEYFIEKYKVLDNLIKNKIKHNSFIYEGNNIYGHLDLQKTCITPEVDYYMNICPDINFHPYLIPYFLESAKIIKNKYFFITPQIFKSWDSSWDILVNDKFQKIPYSNHLDVDIHEIDHICSSLDFPSLKSLDQFKFAGWCDLYSKSFYEELVPVLDNWTGYGGWDFYSMNVCNIAKSKGVDICQYLLENQVIWFYDVGCLKNTQDPNGDGQLKMIYKNQLSIKLGRHIQRTDIDTNLREYLQKWINYAKQKNII